jgi:hypothetical protein
MVWSWRFEKTDGSDVTVTELPQETFTNQADAETWLGENWRDLLAAGVDQVTLLDDGGVAYGPMSLHPENGDE